MKHPCTIAEFEQYEKECGKQFSLITDSGDVLEILSEFQVSDEDYDNISLFVSIKDGDYDEAWAFYGCVPWLDKPIQKLERR